MDNPDHPLDFSWSVLTQFGLPLKDHAGHWLIFHHSQHDMLKLHAGVCREEPIPGMSSIKDIKQLGPCHPVGRDGHLIGCFSANLYRTPFTPRNQKAGVLTPLMHLAMQQGWDFIRAFAREPLDGDTDTAPDDSISPIGNLS